ncbi:MAG: fumarylacetoacetate hydrolase family protein [Bacteroidota bacterium]
MPSFAGLAERLDRAAQDAQPIPQISLEQSLSETEAYEVQALSLAQRYARGEHLIGLKLGFTSKAKMDQMGVHDMIWGRLTDQMYIDSGGTLDMDRFIHPRVEPEICFRVGRDLPWPLSKAKLLDYIDGVAPALEVIDSRYQNFKFSLEDVIADNCSSAAFVVGPWMNPHTPLAGLAISLKVNGETVQSGNSDAILGDPWESVLAAARLGNQYGQPIFAGSYLMAGAATSAVYLDRGQAIEAEIESLGTIGFSVAP